ncbi:MAG TPA: 2-amino-4-hydroxy-6-hydroxymethyldihydropteridine diphosphokinase [Nitrolancea sp.]|nr:2-amino-4-hydroxy-6-hydroxymethyldihydropteridine diphosphokinase [Nitrolancea sp.]
MARAYLGLGANLGDRAETLRQALGDLRTIGQVVRVSSLYETEPVGYTDQPRFLNAVALLETTLGPHELLAQTSAIEQAHGRQRSFANAPRTLDIDILCYDDLVLDCPKLTIPHPRLQERAFMLVPLTEIAPDLRHPLLGQTARELLEQLTREARDEVRVLCGPKWSRASAAGRTLE